jgi:hypothetical protein
VLIDTTDQESNTVGSGHRSAFGAFVTFTEVNGNIRDWLGDSFDTHGFIEVESVVLGFNSGVINENSSIANDTRHGADAVTVDLNQLLRLVADFHQFAWW